MLLINSIFLDTINHQWSILASIRHVQNNGVVISVRPEYSNDSISRRQISTLRKKKKEQLKPTYPPPNNTNQINISAKHVRDGLKKNFELVD